MADEADNQPSTSSGNPGGLTFIKRNGGLVLLRAGYQYTKKRENKNGWSHWRCVKVKECSGSLQIKDGNISNEKNHSCEPDEVKNVMAKQLNNLREMVLKSDFTPIPRIYNTFKSQFSEAEQNLVKNIPSFQNTKTKLYKARNKEADVSKIKCKSVDEVEIPLQFRDFVLYDYIDESNTRIIILAHPNQLAQIAKIKAYECDGTFKCCPVPFVQLYSIHLPLLPRDLISQGWCYIMEDSPESVAIEAFNNYMVSQWLENESFVDTWCVYGEPHRTTNSVESWYMKLNSTVPKNANLYQLLKALKEYADLQSVVVNQYMTNVPDAKRRAMETIAKNRWITYVTDQLREQKISVVHCLEKLRV